MRRWPSFFFTGAAGTTPTAAIPTPAAAETTTATAATATAVLVSTSRGSLLEAAGKGNSTVTTRMRQSR